MNKGVKYASIDDYETAQKYFDKAYNIDTTYLTALFNKATGLGDLKRYTESNEILLNLRKRGFNGPDVYFNIAKNYIDLANYDNGLIYADSAILINQSDIGSYILKAQILSEKEDYDGASEVLIQALSKNKYHYDANCMLACVLGEKESYDLALVYLENATTYFPKKYLAYYLKWGIYSFKNDKSEACKNYQLAIKYGYKKEDWFSAEKENDLIRCE